MAKPVATPAYPPRRWLRRHVSGLASLHGVRRPKKGLRSAFGMRFPATTQSAPPMTAAQRLASRSGSGKGAPS